MTVGGSEDGLRDLLSGYETYDQHVDVVSAFEWLFTHTRQMPATVRHFERFPKVRASDGVESTPDFTVVLTDGRGIVGEISKLALHENSIDKAVKQLGKYANIDRLPAEDGRTVSVSQVDVLQLVNIKVGLPAVQRIIRERMLDPEHSYKPLRAPCIAQFARDSSTYTIQRIPDADNGNLPISKSPVTLGYLLGEGLNIHADRFKDVKAARKFINDPIHSLYLATHLWTQHWPSVFGRPTAEDVVVDPGETAEDLRAQFGKCRVAEVRSALGLLFSAGLAAENDDGTWMVSRRLLRQRGERDVHRIIAQRSVRQAKPLVTGRSGLEAQRRARQDTLF